MEQEISDIKIARRFKTSLKVEQNVLHENCIAYPLRTYPAMR